MVRERVIWQNEHYPDIVKGGGGARNTRHITASMVQHGCALKILARNVNGQSFSSAQVDGIEVVYYPRHPVAERLWPIRGILDALLLHRIVGPTIRNSTLNFCIDPEFVFAMKRVSPDVPVICRVEGTRAGDRASWHSLLKRPAQASVRRSMTARTLSLQDDELNRRAWLKSDGLVVKSRLILEELVNWYRIPETKIRIIPNGVDYAHYAHAVAQDDVLQAIGKTNGQHVVTFVGRLSTVKNLALLIRAFSMLARSDRALLMIIGDGEDRPQLEGLAEQLGVRPRVRFVGHKDDVAPYLAVTDVFVLTSLYETIANCLLEAMSAAVPCIALKPDGKRVRTSSDEVIKPHATGLLVEEDAVALAAAIDSVLANREAATEMGAKGQQLVRETFDWNSCAESYLAFGTELRARFAALS